MRYQYTRIYEAVPKNPGGDLAGDYVNRVSITLEFDSRLKAYVLSPSVINMDPELGLSSVIYSLNPEDELSAVTKKLVLEQAKRQSKKRIVELAERFDEDIQELIPNIERYLSVDWARYKEKTVE